MKELETRIIDIDVDGIREKLKSLEVKSKRRISN